MPWTKASAGRITSLVSHPRRRGSINVYVDGMLAFGVSEPVALRAGLRPGLFLTAEDGARLLQEDESQRALDRALVYLSFRARSEREVRLRLGRAGNATETIDSVIVRLRELGLVDDLAFSRQWITNRDQLNPKGNRALKAELAHKGVSREVADQAVVEGGDDEARARNLAEGKSGRYRNLDARAFHQRLSAMLLRRGFSYEVAMRVTREIWKQQDNQHLLGDRTTETSS